MKKKDKFLIENMNYLDNEMAKKMLRNMKNSDIIFYLTYFFITIIYFSLIFVRISTTTLLLFSIMYVVFVIELRILQQLYIQKTIKESINKTICPEACYNLSLYNAKKIFCKQKAYYFYLNNIAKAYILLGKTEKATKIIRQLDKNKKNIYLQGQILQNKIEIAFMKRDIKEFNRQHENLNKIFKFLPRKFRNEVRLDNKIKQAVLERNIDEVNNLCDQNNNKETRYQKVLNAYYKGTVLEKSGQSNYEECYKFVAENGNNLIIANQIREKMKITDFNYIYKTNKHLIYNTFKFLSFVSSLIFCLAWITLLAKHL